MDRPPRSRGRQIGVDGEVLEAVWQAQVRRLAGMCGWLDYHTHDSTRSTEGFPDLVLAKPGHPVIYAELKRWNGVTSMKQVKWLDVLSQGVGTAVFVWRADKLIGRPLVWEEITAILTRGPDAVPLDKQTTRWRRSTLV